MSELLEQRIADMERRLSDLHARLDETASQTNSHNHQLGILNAKLDEIRNTLKDLKTFPDNFVPRAEMQARLDAAQAQINMLSAAVAKSQDNHLMLLGSVHTNTLATYGTLIMAGIAMLGLIITLIVNLMGPQAHASSTPGVIKPPPMTRMK